jgi:MtrB/PioB family decaheme-associated outer membrane protein
LSKIKSARMESTVRADRPRFQVKLLTALVGAALAQVAAPALADSGTDGDPWVGNALNPAGITTVRPIDPDGLGGQLSRTPTGFLESNPFVVQPFARNAAGWQYRGIAEVGFLGEGGDKDAQKWREYKDLSSGLYLNNFLLEAERPESLTYVRVLGGAWGRDDQYAGLTVGQYNGYRLRAFYNQTPHVFTTTYRNLWSGEGTGNVTLRSLPPGGTTSAAVTDAAIEQAALATPYSQLSLLRQKGGVRFDMPLSETWKVYASATSEKRTGARPFGLVSGGGGGTGAIEIPESIDYDTHDFVAGVNWATDRTSVNVHASASLFRNNVGTMTIDNPMFLPAANGISAFPRAVYDLYPDNDAYNLKGEVSHAFGGVWSPRFTGVYSATRYRQNDALIPSTPYPGAAVATTPVSVLPAGQWDTTASLSRQTADQRLDTQLIDLQLGANPIAALDLKVKWRQYETDNNSPEYLACNPLTGQWGRLVNEGSGSAFVTNAAYSAAGVRCNLDAIRALNQVPSAGNINIASVPYEYKQTNTGITADYRFAQGQSVNGLIERESFDRQHRERDETWEDKLKLGYVNRSLAGGTLRLSAEHDRRRGSEYNPDPYEEFYSASMGPLPTAAGSNMTSWIHINSLHRKFDLADRDQNILNAKFNWALREDLDLGVSGQLKSSKYPNSAYGRNDTQKTNTINADLNWQPTTKTSLYGYGSYQKLTMSQQGVQQNACALGSNYFFYSDGSFNNTGTLTAQQQAAGITVIGSSGVVTASNFAALCGTASPTSPLYPTSRAWSATQDESSPSLGVGFKHDFGKALLDLNYTYLQSKAQIAYTYNAVGLGLNAATTALAGSGMSDLVFKQHIVNASVLFPVNEAVAIRLLARYEVGKFKDWHYEGVATNPSPAANQQTYLDAGPQDYKAYAFGAFLQLKW